MKKYLIILASLFLISCISKSQKSDGEDKPKEIQEKKLEKPNVRIQEDKKGIFKNDLYTNSALDWNIAIPEEYKIYYPINYREKEIEIPEVITNNPKNGMLVSFGLNGKNYFSAYLKPSIEKNFKGKEIKDLSRNYLNGLKDIARDITEGLKDNYSENREIAFKQNWGNKEIDGKKYSIYDIKIVSYPDEISIINQLVYVRKTDNDNLFFSITYDNQKEKNLLLANLLTSIE